MTVTLTIPGRPAPKGSRVVGTRRDGSHFTRESSRGAGPWAEAVALVARAHRPNGRALPAPYRVELAFSMPRGQRPKYDWPTRDGDLDKLVRATLDGLVRGELIVDDRHVTELAASKCWAGRPSAEGVVATVVGGTA